MPSITHWNRLEPRPAAPSIAETLTARLRDPLWMLTRQWQFGEYRGEDAGSPAYVRVRTTCTPLTAWRTDTGPWQPLDGRAPLEALVATEPLAADDLSLQVELAHTFERLLRARGDITAAGIDAVLDELRAALPLAAPLAADRAAVRFFTVCGPRAFDGAALVIGFAAGADLPADAAIDPGDLQAVQGALESLVSWTAETFGPIGSTDPPAWQEERLSYAAAAAAQGTAGERWDFTVDPELEGSLDWYAFDLARPAPDAGEPPQRPSTSLDRTVLPTNVRFRGMPSARWWAFEDARTDFGDLRPDRRDAATLVVMDFMLVHGNDWFLVPFDQPIGTVCHIDELVVRDVFGGFTTVPRADRAGGGPGRWTLFTSATDREPERLGELLVLPPSVTTATQLGEPIEEVRLFRDELANLVWAVEATVPGGAGEPWPGAERSTAITPSGTPATATAGLHYVIQTPVPYHWIPFLPAALDPQRPDIALERGSLLDVHVNPPAPIAPIGRLLRPRAGAEPYRIREEEVSRSGIRLHRVACRSRWTDGSTWLWTTRQRSTGGGEGSSGLRFDDASPGAP